MNLKNFIITPKGPLLAALPVKIYCWPFGKQTVLPPKANQMLTSHRFWVLLEMYLTKVEFCKFYVYLTRKVGLYTDGHQTWQYFYLSRLELRPLETI